MRHRNLGNDANRDVSLRQRAHEIIRPAPKN